MFDEIYDLLDKIEALDENAAWIFVMDRDTKREIIRLNTADQLGEHGIDADSDSLGEYAPFTVRKKEAEGKGVGRTVSHVTFFDTGDYWKSWKVRVTDKEWIIEVDTQKFDELVNVLSFAPEHVGLTEEHQTEISEGLIFEKYQEWLLMQLGV
jgi:hypothetical protein